MTLEFGTVGLVIEAPRLQISSLSLSLLIKNCLILPVNLAKVIISHLLLLFPLSQRPFDLLHSDIWVLVLVFRLMATNTKLAL